MKRHKINNKRFSIRLCSVASTYGFKTVGSMYKALKQAKPTAKWSFNTSYMRGAILLREIEEYLSQ
jgi:hypothetical protein